MVRNLEPDDYPHFFNEAELSMLDEYDNADRVTQWIEAHDEVLNEVCGLFDGASKYLVLLTLHTAMNDPSPLYWSFDQSVCMSLTGITMRSYEFRFRAALVIYIRDIQRLETKRVGSAPSCIITIRNADILQASESSRSIELKMRI